MISCFCFVFLFQYYFNEGAYLPFMSIFNKALKDVLFIFFYLRKGQCFPFNVEYWTNKIMRGLNFSSSSLIRFKQQQMLESRETVNDKIVILDMVKKHCCWKVWCVVFNICSLFSPTSIENIFLLKSAHHVPFVKMLL